MLLLKYFVSWSALLNVLSILILPTVLYHSVQCIQSKHFRAVGKFAKLLQISQTEYITIEQLRKFYLNYVFLYFVYLKMIAKMIAKEVTPIPAAAPDIKVTRNGVCSRFEKEKHLLTLQQNNDQKTVKIQKGYVYVSRF